MFSQGTHRFSSRTIFCFLVSLSLCVLIVSTSCHLSLSTQSTAKKEVAKVRTPTPDQLRVPDEELKTRGLEALWQREVLDGPFRNVYVRENYVFAVAEKGKKYQLVTYDRASGHNVWTQSLDRPLSHAPSVYRYPQSSNQPAEVFVLQGDIVVCMDLKQGGYPLWKRELDFPVSSGICVTESRYFLGSFDRRIYAMPKNHSVSDWQYITDGDVRAPGAVNDVSVYFASTDGLVYRFHEARGANHRNFWRFPTDAAVLGSPVAHSRWVFAASTDYKLYALLQRDGSKDWEFQAQAPIAATPVVGSFALRPEKEILFCVSRDDRPRNTRKTLWALDIHNEGERLWRFDHVAKVVAVGRKSVYVLADRRLNRGRILLSIDVETGKENFAISVEGFDIIPVSASPSQTNERHRALIILAHHSGFMQALAESF